MLRLCKEINRTAFKHTQTNNKPFKHEKKNKNKNKNKNKSNEGKLHKCCITNLEFVNLEARLTLKPTFS